MVRLDQGISVLPMWIVDRDLRGGQLHFIRRKERPLVARIAMGLRLRTLG
jgi:DNA-binding transcriptional LysR family regulator